MSLLLVIHSKTQPILSLAEYYYITDGKQMGPISREEILTLPKDTLVWRQGLRDWTPLFSLQELREKAESSISAPPPVPFWASEEIPHTPLNETKEEPNKHPYRKIVIIIAAIFTLAAVVVLFWYSNHSKPKEEVTSSTTAHITRKCKSYAVPNGIDQLRTTSARLNGHIICNDPSIRSFRFKYSDGSIVKYNEIEINPGQRQISCQVDNLVANTPYAFCIEVESRNNIYESPWESFVTLPTPQVITQSKARNRRHGNSLINIKSLKGNKRLLAEACNYQDSLVNQFAKLIVNTENEKFNLGHICDLFDYCYDNWQYIERRPNDRFHSASSSISDTLKGDENDFAILLCSALIAIGGEARINITINEDGAEHAYTEINLGYINLREANDYLSRRYRTSYSGSVNYRVDQYGHQWLNLDWFAKHPGGEYYDGVEGTRIYLLSNYCESF